MKCTACGLKKPGPDLEYCDGILLCTECAEEYCELNPYLEKAFGDIFDDIFEDPT